MTNALRCTENTSEGKIFEGGTYGSRRRMARVLSAAGYIAHAGFDADFCVFVSTKIQAQAMRAQTTWENGGSAKMFTATIGAVR